MPKLSFGAWLPRRKEESKILPPAWENQTIHVDVVKMILAQGEAYLKAQMQFALDADKRALALAAACATFSTASLAAALVAFNAKLAPYIVCSFVAVSIWILLAACFSFFSARPTQFALPGNWPEEWWPVADGDLKILIGGETENYQERIRSNAKFLRKNSKYIKASMIMFALVPAVFGASAYIAKQHPDMLWTYPQN